MRKLTLGAVAAVLAGSSLAAAGLPGGPVPARPASAQEQAAFVQWQSPDQDARLSGEALHIKAKVGVHGGVKSWAVEVLAPEDADYPGYGTICERTESRSPAYVNIDCVWDTTAYPNDGGPAQNRPYVVRISVQGGTQSGMFSDGQRPGAHSDDRGVVVSNPVSPPRAVHLAFSEPTKQATVRWAPNPEPDVTSYVVQERIGDGPWKNVGQAGGKVTSFTRNLSAPGTYRYQVAALRAAGTGSDTVQSAWSGPGAEPKQIVVAEPKRPATTTTTAPPYSADGAGDPGAPAQPTDPGVPSPLSASGAVNDPAAPGAPAPEGSGPDAARGGALVSPIQSGSPGSVKSGGATVGGRAAPAAAKPGEPAELDESEGPDTGFSAALPYKQSGAEAPEDGEIGRVLVGLPEAIGDEDTRQLLVPLAAGLLLFVFAMHALYASRRAAAEAALAEAALEIE
jgi:hypothetical protein